MASKKVVKKVEIADDSVVNLKRGSVKSRPVALKEAAAFTVNRIDHDEMQQVPVSFVTPTQTAVQERESYASTDLLIDRAPRAGALDQEDLRRRMDNFAEKLEQAVSKAAPQDSASSLPNVAAEPKDLIKVKFEKFVQLVATRDFFPVLEKNRNEDVILSSNLLTELAGSVEEKGEKKSPVIFLVGLALGVIITYLLINK